MTVVTETPYAERTWTGVETVFSAGFTAAAVTDVLIRFRDAGGVETALTPNVHVGVSIAGGGLVSVIPLAMPSAPGTVIIERETPAVQDINFGNLESFDAGVHERLHDAAARRDAEIKRKAGRALLLNPLGTAYDAMNLPVEHVADPVNGKDAANKAFVESLLSTVASGLPGPAGNNLFTALTESIKTADYTVTVGDRGGHLIANRATAIVFSLPAASTMGDFVYLFSNIGAGPLTIDGAGAELVEGAAGLVLDQGDKCFLFGNGTAARAFVIRAEGRRETETVVASAATADIGATNTEAVEITGSTGITSFGTRPRRFRIVRFTGTPTLTHSGALSLLGGATRTVSAGAVGLYRSDAAGNWRELFYVNSDGSPAALAIATQAEALDGTDNAKSMSALRVAQAIGARGASFAGIGNGKLVYSVAANALTVALKTPGGADPSATDPVFVSFYGNGADAATIKVTSALSLVISAGSTLGTASNVPFRLWIVGFNDSGTLRLGAVNCLTATGIVPLADGYGFSATAEGGAGAADAAGTIYAGSAVTSMPMQILGYAEWTSGLSTAGNWSSAPAASLLRNRDTRLPGQVIQDRRTQTGAMATTTTLIPADNTIPQNTEGAQFMSLAFTPVSVVNLLDVEAYIACIAHSVAGIITAALFDAGGADALGTASSTVAANGRTTLHVNLLKQPRIAGSDTYALRAGGSAAGTTTFNGQAATQGYNGTLTSFIRIKELVA